ncbi:hypothetical protein [Caulifigura coniformis]|uniref:hypothetical protein n=1 Tax=Caulifigura coniformis TaxID=2527983 RepID=UPI00119F8CFC|nr:hypothetical protein [Caulifigura coniformis]
MTVATVDRAAAELSELGVEWPGAALQAARAAKPEEHVLAILSYFREHAPRNGWGPGALVQRLRNSRHHIAIERGWPQAAPKAIQSKQRSDELQKRQAQDDEQKRKAEADASAAARREIELGPHLDSMALIQQHDLAQRVSRELHTHFQRRGMTPYVRQQLLRKLELEAVNK